MSLTAADWTAFKDAMYMAHESFNQKTITWERMTSNLDPFGEDDGLTKTNISLKGLVYYNYMRTWPVARETQTGSMDDESAIVIFNKEYLSELGYLNSNGYFAFDPGHDRFIINGVRYEPAGDTDADQAGAEETLFYLILKREVRSTGDKVYAERS